MERELILERTRAGLEAARCVGRVGGRKRRMTDGKVQVARKLLTSGTPPHEVAHSLGVSVPTLYRWVPAFLRTSHKGLRWQVDHFNRSIARAAMVAGSRNVNTD